MITTFSIQIDKNCQVEGHFLYINDECYVYFIEKENNPGRSITNCAEEAVEKFKELYKFEKYRFFEYYVKYNTLDEIVIKDGKITWQHHMKYSALEYIQQYKLKHPITECNLKLKRPITNKGSKT